MSRIYLTICFLCFFVAVACGQQTFYKIYNHTDGLPSNIVYDVATDVRGYLYVGTDCGVYTFNGRRFKEVPLGECKATTFTDLQFDHRGRLWVRNFSHEIFCLLNDTLQPMTHHFAEFSDSISISRLICRDSSVYINNKLNVYRLNIETFEKEHVVKSTDFLNPAVSVWDFTVDTAGTVFLKAENLFCIKPRQGKLFKFADPADIGFNKSEGRFSYDNGRVFYTPMEEKEVSIYEFSAKGVENVFSLNTSKKSKTLRSCAIDKQGVWFCTTAGLFYHSLQKDSLILVLPTNYYTSKIVKDFEGGYWVSTIGSGLVYIPSLYIKMVSLPNINFTTIAQLPNGNILAGTNRGEIVEFDTTCQVKFKYDAIQQNDLQFVYYDSLRQRIYHSTGYHNLKQKQAVGYSPLSKAVIRLDRNNLLVASWLGAYIMHEDINKPFELAGGTYGLDTISVVWRDTTYQKYGLMLRYGRVRAICKGYQNALFVAFIDNLMAINPQNFASKKIVTADGKPIYATSLIARNDTLWVGTFRQGLLAIDQNTLKVLAHYTTKDNLLSNQCNKIFLHEDQVWIVTSKGINLLHISLNIIENISQKYAIETTVANDILVDKHFVWISTSDGLLQINNNLATNLIKPRLYINEIKLGNEVYKPQTGLRFPNTNNDLSIAFEAVTYQASQFLSYQYRLIGVDSAWRILDKNQEFLTFPAIKSGEYTLELRVKNNNSSLPYESQQVSFVVLPPFWFELRFIVISLIILAALLYSGVVQYVRYTTRAQKIREQFASSQLAALRARMNPHFLYNILNTIQALIYANLKKEATTVLGNFSELMRLVLDMSGKETVSLEAEFKALTLYTQLENVRFGEELHFKLELQLPEEISPSDINIPSMIIQPIVENAIKHGVMHRTGDKYIDIIFKMVTLDLLEITIKDNGIGRKQSAEINKKRIKSHVSFATKAISQRLQLLNQSRRKPITINIVDRYNVDNDPLGTTVNINIPL